MSDIVGIDLGTTNSLIGVMDSGFPVLLADENGQRLTPSVVHFPEYGEPLVGMPAARMRILKPDSTIYSIKRFIGLRGEDIEEDMMNVPFRVVGRRKEKLGVQIWSREYLPEEISALILGKLKKDAEHALGRTVARAVITVPAYFN
ncbi:MAG: Chaperone protein dnaK, partial [Spartobacteria bacterium]|nr:Chaperone protein dnaK [Spartobacteria bacterium]